MKCDFLYGSFHIIVSALYPKQCVCCGRITEKDADVCSGCRKALKYINLENRCAACGREKDYCMCNLGTFRFKEVVSVFRYEGAAKMALFRYKFKYHPLSSEYISQQMAGYIMEAYGDIAFNVICYVPTDRKTVWKHGFDHSKLLAYKLSNILKVPVCEALKAKNGVKKQHNSSIEERFKNVVGKYSHCRDVTGKRILLIDDVMTTGATLNECTRRLMFAGAADVYCATMLNTFPKIKKLKKSKR